VIIRVKHEKNYTVISDHSLRDDRLSFRATGVLAYLLSLPDGTELSGVRLVAAKAEGRDAVYTALKELQDAGYLLRTKRQDETGHWYTSCTVRELPGNPPPITGFQKSVTRQSVNQELKAFSTSSEYQEGNAPLEITPAPMPAELRARLPKHDQDDEQTA